MRAALALLRVTPGRRQREQPRADDSGRALGPAGYILTSDRLIENPRDTTVLPSDVRTLAAIRVDRGRGGRHHHPTLQHEGLP